MSRWVYTLVWLEICLIPAIPHVLNHDWLLLIALYAALYGVTLVAVRWVHRPTKAKSENQDFKLNQDGFLVIEGCKSLYLETRRFKESELPQKLLRGSSDAQANFYTRALDAGGVSPWKTSAELSFRKPPFRHRRYGRCSASPLLLFRLSPRSLEALLKVNRLKARRREK